MNTIQTNILTERNGESRRTEVHTKIESIILNVNYMQKKQRICAHFVPSLTQISNLRIAQLKQLLSNIKRPSKKTNKAHTKTLYFIFSIFFSFILKIQQ